MFTDDELKSIYKEFGIKNNDFLAASFKWIYFNLIFHIIVHVWENCH